MTNFPSKRLQRGCALPRFGGFQTNDFDVIFDQQRNFLGKMMFFAIVDDQFSHFFNREW